MGIKTALFQQQEALGGKMMSFAGYDMPSQFDSSLSEVLHIRQGGAGIFDISHMGHLSFSGPDLINALEKILPFKIHILPEHSLKYSLILNEKGGVIDDVMVYRHSNAVHMVVNAARIEAVLKHFRAILPKDIVITHHMDKCFMALQGAQAEDILKKYIPQIEQLTFLQAGSFAIKEKSFYISRSSYCGEDGFEILSDSFSGVFLYDLLLTHHQVKACGLIARDILRLEAGLCLYGSDLTEDITPLEAGLSWCLSKEKTAAQAYIGAKALSEVSPYQQRIGFMSSQRTMLRQGYDVFNHKRDKIGFISSGAYSPSLKKSIGMGYCLLGQESEMIFTHIRGKDVPLELVKLPFIQHRYKR